MRWSATTEGSLSSDDPGGLIVKARGYNAIMLMWNARADDIVAAPVTGYKIESSPLNAAGDDCAEDWSTLVEDTMSTTTSYTHMGLAAGTGMCYRVFGINIVDVSTSFVGYGDDVRHHQRQRRDRDDGSGDGAEHADERDGDGH